jgi:CheY-like chemotaxis protein
MTNGTATSPDILALANQYATSAADPRAWTEHFHWRGGSAGDMRRLFISRSVPSCPELNTDREASAEALDVSSIEAAQTSAGDNPAPAPSPQSVTPPEGTPPPTILLVEDNPSNIRLIQMLLDSKTAYKLVTAERAGVGLQLAAQAAPDAILLDLLLPDMSGEEVLRQLKIDPVTRHIPVIVLSAEAASSRIARVLAAGARHFLTKPLDLMELLHVLNETLAHRDRGSA